MSGMKEALYVAHTVGELRGQVKALQDEVARQRELLHAAMSLAQGALRSGDSPERRKAFESLEREVAPR